MDELDGFEWIEECGIGEHYDQKQYEEASEFFRTLSKEAQRAVLKAQRQLRALRRQYRQGLWRRRYTCEQDAEARRRYLEAGGAVSRLPAGQAKGTQGVWMLPWWGARYRARSAQVLIWQRMAAKEARLKAGQYDPLDAAIRCGLTLGGNGDEVPAEWTTLMPEEFSDEIEW